MSPGARPKGWLARTLLACGLGVAPSLAAIAASTPPVDIDQLAARAQKTFSVPGMAIAVVKDDKIVFEKGYGVREVGKPGRVDAQTLFGIGSNTKAFTVAALGMLVDQGKLHWDDKVIDHIPQFRLMDPWVTRQFTIRDMLTHRSGLGLGAGDLMIFPQTDFTRSDIIHNLRFLKPVSSFRSKFDYDNLLYIVAGQLIPATTGVSWEDFVQKRILDRLGTGCAANLLHAGRNPDVASPHVTISGTTAAVAPDKSTAFDPAGSIECSAQGMAKWMILQLADGRIADGLPLFSKTVHADMWTPQTIITPLPSTAGLTQTHFLDYGLGWFLENDYGYRRVWHTGGLIGEVSYVSLIPSKHLGIVVLTNQESGGAIYSVMQTLLDAYFGSPRRDWVAYWSQRTEKQDRKAADADRAANAAIAKSGGHAAMPLDAYVGTYHDPWRGDATVSRTGDTLRLSFSHTHDMTGTMHAVKGNVFVVRWDDRSLKADALVNFETGFADTVRGMTMKALSPTTDFSFDFHDLDFTRQAEATGPAAR
ncbi:serine hydrolase [Lichenicoccus sp.]|uniref:serine hydrolase n=1 Tax=Lichenicoccus sp. TaxID=2781899 RepID=UPI003D0F8D83